MGAVCIPVRGNELYRNRCFLGLKEGSYIYAYDYHANIDYGWHAYVGEGETLGIAGFTSLEDLE